MGSKRYRRRSKKRYSKKNSVPDFVVFVFVGLLLLLGVAALLTKVNLPNVDSYVSLFQLVLYAAGLLLLLYFFLVPAKKIIEYFNEVSKKLKRQKKIERQYAIATANRSFSHMDWREFEYFVGELYLRQDYQVEVTKAIHDEGIDGKLFKDGKCYVTQAKYYKVGNNVQRPEVQKFAGAMLGYDGGVLITTSDFSRGAYEFAKDIDRLTLINGAQLRQMTAEIKLKK